MQSKNRILLVCSVIVILLSGFIALNGLNIGGASISPAGTNIKQGLDLRGGVFVVYEAQSSATGDEMDRIISQTIEVFRRRVDGMGLTEPIIVREGEKRIRIELPGVEDSEQAISTIGKTAQLQFIMPDGEVVVSGAEVSKAEVMIDNRNNQPFISLEFNAEGSRKFAEATRKLAPTSEPLFIVLDDEVISSPIVNEEIPNGKAQITGQFTVEGASELAGLIRAGALPVDFEEVQSSTITATLGETALEKSIQGAIIGILLVMLFMIIYYRLPGLVAVLSLMAYMIIFTYTYILMNATLTLPGIAALILSVGMAVDANVIIFERIKEELSFGKSVRVSIDSGFDKAMSTILDSQVTTFIAGIVLYNFGTGPIRGFAITLMIGLVVSMLTAIVITRFLLKITVGAMNLKNTKYFGV